MSDLRSYPKVYNMGHRQLKQLFDGEVVVQEKVDGSQFSFGKIDGEVYCRSRRRQIPLPAEDALFRGACETAMWLEDDLVEGSIYRGECISKPKHNSLEYERVPKGFIALFDIDVGLEDRVGERDALELAARKTGLEIVPEIFRGTIDSLDMLMELVKDTKPFLGGLMIEGVVVKNYDRFGEDGKMLMGKVVREEFQELHAKKWGEKNPSRTEFIERLKARYRSEPRWEKAVQHVREAGELTGSPVDIGRLIKEVKSDVEEECREEIMEALYKEFWPKINRGLTAGLPEWYKAKLLEAQFSQEE